MKHDETVWLRQAQKIAKLGNWDQDPITGELWWSDQTYLLFNLDPQKDKMTFEKFLRMIHPDDREIVKERTSKSLASDQIPYRVEYRIIATETNEKFVYEEAVIERDEKGVPVRMIGVIQDITERKKVENEREELIRVLQSTLEEVNTLRGIIPICASCKKIRDENGYWNQVEEYIQQHTEAAFTHGICEDCVSTLYPSLGATQD